MNAVVINSQGDILYYFTELEASVKEVKVAGAVTIDGTPVNTRTYRVSRSKANLAKANRCDCQPLKKYTHNGEVFYTE